MEAAMSNYEELPTLYTVDSMGKARQWTVMAKGYDDGTVLLCQAHGLVDGKIQTGKPKQIKKAASQPTLWDQAVFEANSAWKKKYKLGARETVELAIKDRPTLPMRAAVYQKGQGRYPAFAQPKLNGVRSLSRHVDAAIELISRGNERYNGALGHLIEPLKQWGGVDKEWCGDGEVYKHGWSLQKISGLARADEPTPGVTELLQYWIYDMFDEVLPYDQRLSWIKTLFKGTDQFGPLVMVPTVLVSSEDEFQKFHDELVKLGFEGAILRQPKGMYKGNLYKSPDMEKLKDFIDHEFEIIGGRPAEGAQGGCVIFRVRGEAKDKEDKLTGKVVEFDVVPKGDLDLRRKWMNEIDTLIGRQLTVRYFELSDDGVPQGNPVGECIRDYE